MRRRRIVALMLALVPAAALAQLGPVTGRSGMDIGRRPGVDEALRRTLTLVLRAEARSNGLPSDLSDPQPLSAEQIALLAVGARLPDNFPVTAAPPGVDRRLPHARGGSVWASAGTWMIEVDPVRMRILTVAPDVLPPEL